MEILKIEGDKTPALTCESATGDGCNDKETGYITKMGAKNLDGAALGKQIDRLVKMKGEPMSADTMNWLERRLRILNQMNTRTEL